LRCNPSRRTVCALEQLLAGADRSESLMPRRLQHFALLFCLSLVALYLPSLVLVAAYASVSDLWAYVWSPVLLPVELITHRAVQPIVLLALLLVVAAISWRFRAARLKWAIPLVTFIVWSIPPIIYALVESRRDRGPEPVYGEYIGWTRTAIEAKHGPPSHEWQGHYGPPVDEEYARKHDPAVTVIYERGDGTLYVSFEKKNGEWICFRSDWMPTGWVF
jgi:hypothetical protein